jgi:hypothetical protein
MASAEKACRPWVNIKGEEFKARFECTGVRSGSNSDVINVVSEFCFQADSGYSSGAGEIRMRGARRAMSRRLMPIFSTP